jgi:hypothetical protein
MDKVRVQGTTAVNRFPRKETGTTLSGRTMAKEWMRRLELWFATFSHPRTTFLTPYKLRTTSLYVTSQCNKP